MDRPLSPALTQGTKLVSYSPFRISFAGGGTDINPFCDAYGGSVINTTIDRGVTVIYTPGEYELEISSLDSFLCMWINDRTAVVSALDDPRPEPGGTPLFMLIRPRSMP